MIQQLIDFYSQKYHVPIELATFNKHFSNTDKQVILVGKLSKRTSIDDISEGTVIEHCGKPVARIGDNFLILRFNQDNEKADKLTTRLIDKHLPIISKRFRQKQLSQFLKSMENLAENITHYKESSIRLDQNEINRHWNQIAELNRKIGLDRILLGMFRKSKNRIRNKAIRFFVDLNKLVPGVYSHFKVENNCIIGTTQEIIIHYYDHEYKFAPYEVEVNIFDSKIMIRGDSNDVRGYIHPHISGESICWGNIGSMILDLLGRMEFYALFNLIHSFLSTYNEDDPYLKIQHWDPNWVDDEYEEEPYCVFCDENGHDVSDCEDCWWCEACQQWVDHDEDDCPYREDNTNEAA